MRSRNIKPGFFKNENLAELPPESRLLFIGLWCMADREGRLEDRPKRIKIELFAYDELDINNLLDLLQQEDFIKRYEINSKKYIQINNFTKHQMPHHKEVASEIPAPEGYAQITKHAYDVPETVKLEVFQRDGKHCLKCGSKENLSLDHIKPLASGGENNTDNLQTLCKRCNSSKGNTIKDYRKSNVESIKDQRKSYKEASCPPDSLIPDSLIPDSGLSDSSSTVYLIPLEQKAMMMTINDFRFLFTDNFETSMPPGCNQLASELCQHYPRDAIIEAFRIAAEQGKYSAAYVKGVLMGNGKAKAASCEYDPAKDYEPGSYFDLLKQEELRCSTAT